MEKKRYLALVLREANAFVNAHERVLRAAPSGAPDERLRDALEEQLRGALVEADHLEDVLKHSELREVPPDLWRQAESWEEVLTSVAMAALAHDVMSRARDVVEGRIPRMDNIQLH